MLKQILTNSGLNTKVFPTDIEKNVLKYWLDVNSDNITASFISRDDFNKLNGDFLVKEENNYILSLPNDLKKFEMLSMINHIEKTLGLNTYYNIDNLLAKTKLSVSLLLENVEDKEKKYFIKLLKKEHNIDDELFEKIQKQEIKPTQDLRKFIKEIKENRQNKNDKKISKDDTKNTIDLLAGEFEIGFDSSFLKNGLNLLKYGMMTFIQEEQENLIKYCEENGFTKEKDNYGNITYKKGTEIISIKISSESLDKEEWLLMEKINIDYFKEKLEKVRQTGNKEKIEMIELAVTKLIIKTLYEYPYQLTKNNYGYQPSKILKFKELYCLGFSILGHVFLDELKIKHKGIYTDSHSTLEVIINGKNYYFDPTILGTLVKFKWGKNLKKDGKKINLKEIIFEDGTIINGASGNIENMLQMKILNNLGSNLNNEGKNSEAIKILEKTIKLNKTNSNSYHNLGNFLNDLGNKTKANEMFKKAFELEPESVKSYYDMGMIYYADGDYETSIGLFKKLLKIAPKNYYIYYLIGEALEKLGKQKDSNLYHFASAVLHGRQIISEHPTGIKIQTLIQEKKYTELNEYLIETCNI